MTVPFLAPALVLGTARLPGECARRVRQPAVLGEIVGGVVLGPTVLGVIAPDVSASLFPVGGPAAAFLDAFSALSAEDGERVRLVVLVLTPTGRDDERLELIADVARTLQQAAVRERILHATGHTEFLAAVRTAESR